MTVQDCATHAMQPLRQGSLSALTVLARRHVGELAGCKTSLMRPWRGFRWINSWLFGGGLVIALN
jgi:hypothetical protein